VQHGEEERCERGGAVVEAGGGHLKRAGSGAARLSLPGPQPTLLACAVLGAVLLAPALDCYGYAVWATTVGMRSQFCAKATACACLQRGLTSLRGAAAFGGSSIGWRGTKKGSSAHVGSCEARLIVGLASRLHLRLSLG
jgi:hypothetical protein